MFTDMPDFVLFTIKITIALILDAIFGDPYHYPHPVRFIGSLITWLENRLIGWKRQRVAGAVLLVVTVVTVYLASAALCSLSVVVEVILIYNLFALRSLKVEALKIYNILKKGDLQKARVQLSYIVSRQTEGLDEENVIRGTVETVAENIVDGIISPLFFLIIGGLPLAMAYKAVNTLDSMVGYKNERYLHFGWAGARFDDLANFIPARLTGFILIPIAALFCRGSMRESFRIMTRDRYNHASPNSAHSEAAAAGALGLRMGGPSVYHGKLVEKPYIGDYKNPFQPEDILRVNRLLTATSLLGVFLMLSFKFICS